MESLTTHGIDGKEILASDDRDDDDDDDD